jgi:hypothetical protein
VEKQPVAQSTLKQRTLQKFFFGRNTVYSRSSLTVKQQNNDNPFALRHRWHPVICAVTVKTE